MTLMAPRDGVAPLEERKERREEMLADRAGGMTLRQIADRYGLSRERVRQILATDPKENGWPRERSLIRQQEKLIEKRALWAKRESEAGRAHVAAIDEELTAIATELAAMKEEKA
ncbi:MAG: sigma factor-like helix-turn-helix DNA-binding protein [Limnohabitans sp.]